MLTMLQLKWWHFLVRGLVAIAFGVLAIAWPGAMLVTLVILFGAFVLADGLLAIVTGIATAKSADRWWAMLLAGIAGVVVGVLTFIWPGMTALVLLYLIAAWSLTRGVLEIAAAIRLRKVVRGEWVLVLSGILSILLAAVLFVFPGAGALGMIWVIGAYAIADGALLGILGFRLLKLKRDAGKAAG